jgi:hypothetical protein
MLLRAFRPQQLPAQLAFILGFRQAAEAFSYA